jgi:predicted nuclease of predicted toxin-antitoxin system
VKFLLDEHAEYYQKELEKQNHKTESAKKLRIEDPKYRNDYNLIEYAKEHFMTIITKDGDLGQACKDNNFPCIWITDDKIFEKIIQPELDIKLIETVDTKSTDDEILDDFNKIKSGEASRMSQKSSG